MTTVMDIAPASRLRRARASGAEAVPALTEQPSNRAEPHGDPGADLRRRHREGGHDG